MPVYTFKNTETAETFDIVMSISELSDYKKSNPHLTQLILSAPALADPYSVGRVKPTSDFNDLLKGIKKKHRGSTIETWK